MTTSSLQSSVQANVPEKYRLGDSFVPKTRYLDPEFLQLEIHRLFPRTWQMACRVEELFDIGDFVEYQIADWSILVVRESSDRIAAYHNTCRHRGTRLASGRGRVAEIRCPFHGWRWNLDGSIKMVLDPEEFEPRSDADLALRDLKVGTWGGFVFVNMDPDAMPLDQYLAPMSEALEPFRLENMRYRWLKGSIMPCNWKTGIDAFIEGYHTTATHPQLLRLDKTNKNPASMKELDNRVQMPTEVFEYHSRFFNRQRKRDGETKTTQRYERDLGAEYDERAQIAENVGYYLRELRAIETERDLRAAQALLTATVPDGMPVSAYFMTMRRQYALDAGLDWPEITPEQWAKAGNDWHVFPNLVIIPNQGSVLGYRARPNGADPDSCLFEAFNLEQIPVADYEQRWQFTPQFEADWRKADLGEVLSQDFANMEHVTAGMHSPAFDGHRLNTVQETSVHNHHLVADRFLWEA
jgi:phenylpropionate dioxygenase-like ring-hydroxylating dioxygenase large terminal subunit